MRVCELIDLPNCDEPFPASMGQYQNEHTKRWARTIEGFDGFVIVTPEYNHSIPGAPRNALDFVHAGWNNKVVGFVSCGAALGVRSVEHLRQVAGHLQLADVGQTVSLFTEFENMQAFTPADINAGTIDTMLDQLITWTRALMSLRMAAVAADSHRSSRQRAPFGGTRCHPWPGSMLW